jgi:hypothetical protein
VKGMSILSHTSYSIVYIYNVYYTGGKRRQCCQSCNPVVILRSLFGAIHVTPENVTKSKYYTWTILYKSEFWKFWKKIGKKLKIKKIE